jgi:hypothetical protein
MLRWNASDVNPATSVGQDGGSLALEVGPVAVPAEWLDALRGKDLVEGILRR